MSTRENIGLIARAPLNIKFGIRRKKGYLKCSIYFGDAKLF